MGIDDVYDFGQDMRNMRNYLLAELSVRHRPTINEEMRSIEQAVTAVRFRLRKMACTQSYAKCA